MYWTISHWKLVSASIRLTERFHFQPPFLEALLVHASSGRHSTFGRGATYAKISD
jgi:hypothetical protein